VTVGRKRKRYLLLTSNRQIDAEARKEFTRLIVERFPDIERKLVWLDSGLIVRTDVERLAAMKAALALRVRDVQLETRSVSGSISKLKRMTTGGER
jgi:hypothetical protein